MELQEIQCGLVRETALFGTLFSNVRAQSQKLHNCDFSERNNEESIRLESMDLEGVIILLADSNKVLCLHWHGMVLQGLAWVLL